MDFASLATRAAKTAKTGQDGKGLLQSHLEFPNVLAKLWDRQD